MTGKITENSKRCKECLTLKETTSFSKGKAVCKECRAAEAREGRKRECPKCGATHYGSKQELCPQHYKVYRKAYSLHSSCKYRAKKKNIPFDLSIEWLEESLESCCPKTGVLFNLEVERTDYSTRRPDSPSVDKIDPSRGYTQDNCQVVCWWYNVAKQQFTDEEVLEFCTRVVNQNL